MKQFKLSEVRDQKHDWNKKVRDDKIKIGRLLNRVVLHGGDKTFDWLFPYYVPLVLDFFLKDSATIDILSKYFIYYWTSRIKK